MSELCPLKTASFIRSDNPLFAAPLFGRALDNAGKVCYTAGMEEITPLFADRGQSKTKPVADFESASAWKKADVAFNFVNYEYPFPHTHGHWELFFIFKGEISHNINGRSCRIGAADACLIRPADRHFFTLAKSGGDYWHVNFLLKTEYLKSALAPFGEGLYATLLADPEPLAFKIPEPLLDKVLHKCLQIQTLAAENIDWNVLQCKLLVARLLNEFLEQRCPIGKDYPDWLNSFLKYLNTPSSFSDSAGRLAKKTPYVYSHLSRLFKQCVGCTLGQYRAAAKVNYAKELLLHSGRTVLDIAAAAGFDSPSHFNHVFKCRTGLTPTEIKRHALNPALEPQ
ncbi:MAG: helix-turn-helix transcriptional regulator [Clostridiales bacterium]|jgi:AraC family cel operon transcriptional repressor|nr:helix-turn-helix transcriptional regulator [Clostridiales bacterium]